VVRFPQARDIDRCQRERQNSFLSDRLPKRWAGKERGWRFFPRPSCATNGQQRVYNKVGGRNGRGGGKMEKKEGIEKGRKVR
jgi:hypothetical protein